MSGMKLLIHSKNATAAPLKLGMDKHFPTFYLARAYLFMLGFKITHASKREPNQIPWTSAHILGVTHMTQEQMSRVYT